MIFGKRVVLGPIMPPDLTSLFQWTDSAEDAAINGTHRPPSWNEQEEFWLLQQDPSRIFFAIRIKPRSEIAGYIQIREIEPVHRSAKIGIWIGEAAERGKGIGFEALELAIDYCWRQLNLRRLTLEVFAHNEAAIRLYARSGFEREGMLKSAQYVEGAWIDIVLMALQRPGG